MIASLPQASPDQAIQPLLHAITTHFGIPLTADLPYCLIEFAPYPPSIAHMRLGHLPLTRLWVAIVGDQHYCTVAQIVQQGTIRYRVQ